MMIILLLFLQKQNLEDRCVSLGEGFSLKGLKSSKEDGLENISDIEVGSEELQRTCGRSEKTKVIEVAGSQSGFPKKPFSPLMSTCVVSSKHKDAEHRPLVVWMID